MNRQAEREYDQLEEELRDCDDPVERRALQRELREMEREARDEERWREEGEYRGWR